ncbi:MAG: hypothetical protein KKA16_08190 [Alphaproteobacteria bacterium]|nr:hypothetical protein [Alphaproteobacteria bacterium]MBU2378075.1 hypothetical protein [Alphaproteobacteria bacterium]
MTARIVLSSAAVVLALTASACATGPRDRSHSYTAQLDELTESCRARGGILIPIPGAVSGRPQADYACQISGGASRID